MALEILPESNKYYTKLSIGPYVRGKAFALSTFDPRFVVHLPIPTELRDDTTVSYNSVNLETVGDILHERGTGTGQAAVLRNIGNITSAGTSAITSAIGGSVGRIPGVGSAAQSLTSALGGAVQSLIPPEQVSSALQQQTGAAPNPNPSVQFQGPVLRDFTFTWAFYPKNKKESEEIHNLIRKLKARALPSANIGNGGAILNYPHICQLNFYPWDSGGSAPNGWNIDKSIIKIKKCFMAGVNVNYNAYGTPGFFEGTQLPMSYALTISFKEIEYLLSDDWEPSAANERADVVSNTSFDAAKVLVNSAQLVLDTGRTVAGTTSDVAFKILSGVFPTSASEELQKSDNAKVVIDGLINNDAKSKAVFEVITNVSTTPITYSLRKENDKIIVVEESPEYVTGDGITSPSISTTRSFDTTEQAQEYLRTKKVYTGGGKQIEPPLPEAKAAAPK